MTAYLGPGSGPKLHPGLIEAFQKAFAGLRRTEVAEALSGGCTAAMTGVSAEDARKHADGLPWNIRPFFYEGYGIGAAGRKAYHPQSEDPEAGWETRDHIMMRFTGYGLWNGVAKVQGLPEFTRDDGFGGFDVLLSNGAGFAAVMTQGGLTAPAKERLTAHPEGLGRRAAWHGAGRALWFLEGHDQGAIAESLAGAGEAADDLLAGVGFALGFTQAAQPERIESAIAGFAPESASALGQAAGRALRVHSLNDAEGAAHLDGSLAGSVREWRNAAEGVLKRPEDAASLFEPAS